MVGFRRGCLRSDHRFATRFHCSGVSATTAPLRSNDLSWHTQLQSPKPDRHLVPRSCPCVPVGSSAASWPGPENGTFFCRFPILSLSGSFRAIGDGK
jgi:hypothetical protein